MEWAVWTASSDSEDGMTQETNEERSPSKRDQQGSLYGAREQSSTRNAHRSIDLTSVKEVALTRNGWNSMDPGKAEAGKKQSDKGSQDLIHFEKKPGIKPSAPDSMGSTRMVNISEGAVIPDRESENIPMQMMGDDEEQVLVTQEDLGEELEFDSSTSVIEVGLKLNHGRSEVKRKRRNLTEDELGQASKLVKRLEPPQENQMPCARTECGDSALDPSCAQWNESVQSKHLEGNCAAEAPENCTESKEMLSHSLELVEHQEVRTGEGKYHFAECNITCMNAAHLNDDLLLRHRELCTCPEGNKLFVTADGMSEHQLAIHNVEKPFQCKECNLTFNSLSHLNEHNHTAHNPEKPFKCPECNKCFAKADGMSQHRLMLHNVEKPYQCTDCILTFSSALLRNGHCRRTAHGKEKNFKCPECNKGFVKANDVSQHRLMVHNVEKPYQCTLCNLTFNSSSLRNGHCHTSHGMKKNVLCPECWKRFATEEGMIAHRLIIHKVEKPFQCTEKLLIPEPVKKELAPLQTI